MIEDEIKVVFVSKFNINVLGIKEDLKRVERMWYFKLWYYYFDILNYIYIFFMVFIMYNLNLYLINIVKNF